MAKELHDSLEFAEDVDEPQSKPTKKASPKKRNRPTASRRARVPARRARDYLICDSDDSAADPDGETGASAINVRSNYDHDPNTIVLDCDDIFKVGPSVNINRNLAGATACSSEENSEIRVSVIVKGKVDTYTMRPVCIPLNVFKKKKKKLKKQINRLIKIRKIVPEIN